MRVLITLCLMVVAYADKLRYNYQSVGHLDSGLSFTSGGGSISGVGSGSLEAGLASDIGGSGGSGLDNDVGSVIINYSPSSNLTPSLALQGNFSSTSAGNVPPYEPQGEFEKDFYIYSADENDFRQPTASNQLVNSIKKALRVIFIKNPENNDLENAVLGLAKHASEQKTDIYVLQKQADLVDLSNKLNNIKMNVDNKPVVHFVKYRTPEEATNAQKIIQGHYDTLGGRSQTHDGGVAPVLEFASQAPAFSHSSVVSAPASSYNSEVSTDTSATSLTPPVSTAATAEEFNNTYLPASILRPFLL